MHYLIIGFGLTGQAILKYLSKNQDNSDLTITIYDQKEISQSFISSVCADIDLNNSKFHTITHINQLLESNQDIDLAIASPGVYPASYRELLNNKYNIKIISDIQLFANQYLFKGNSRNNNQIYGITGTNGKSTACSLLHFLLGTESCLAGNYGMPAIDILTTEVIKPETVLELSSYQLELTDDLPMIAATCLNISPDHLDWHQGYENYINAKLKIYNTSEFDILDSRNILVLDSYKKNILPEKIKNQQVKIIHYANDSNNQDSKQIQTGINTLDDVFQAGKILDYGGVRVINRNQSQVITFNSKEVILVSLLPEVLKTSHNLNNLLAVLAMLVAKYIHDNNLKSHNPTDIEVAEYLKKCLKNINQFKGLAYRCELVSSFNNIRVYNDSKATNLNATITAINSIGKLEILNNNPECKIILILGGIVKEDIDITESRQEFIDCINNLREKITDLIIFSKDESSKYKFIDLIDEINNSHSNQKNNLSYRLVEDLPSLRELSYQIAKPGDIILFSPAGASFDAFKNYIDRGHQFTDFMQTGIF